MPPSGNFMRRSGIALLVIALLASCSTYYQKNVEVYKAVTDGRITDANKMLDNPAFEKRKRDLLLYYLNRGTIHWMQGNSGESNRFFQLADYYIEDYQKNIAYQALSLISSPGIKPYPGEGFEQILLHYYTTLNYIQLGSYEDALVECKRMHQKMQRLTDYYNSGNKYKRDAFAHLLMGIIYDAQKEYNDAFIAYRNAYEVYRDDYATSLETKAPEQLKKDLVRTAYLSGLSDELAKYQTEFNLTYEPPKDSTGSLIYLWNNGLGPVKDEWSLNFFIIPGAGNMVYFENRELDFRCSFSTSDEHQKNDLKDLKVIRVAIPKYVRREPVFTSGKLLIDSIQDSCVFETAEPVNNIAFKSLKDRMFKELSEALLRLALKQITESQVSKKNEGLGAVVSVINAITEQADTRNWQLLPYSINYTRVELPKGNHQLTLKATGDHVETTRQAEVTVPYNETVIRVDQTLNTYPLMLR